MKKPILITFFTFIFCLLTYPALGFTDNFNVTIHEELITIAGNPGTSYTTTINIETMNPSQTVYFFGLSLPTPASYSASSWITPSVSTSTINNQAPTAVTFTVNIPSTTTAGEYYQAIAVADSPFSDAESADPTTFVAVPIIIQVSETATESTTTTSSSSSSSPSDTSSTSQTTTTTTTPTTTKTKKTTPTKNKTPTIANPSIFSKLNILDFFAKYSLLKQETIFTINVKNDGNIYSIPTGTIQVQNLSKDVIKNLPINPKQSLVKPKSEHTYTIAFGKSQYLIGFFKANLKLIGNDSQISNPQEQNRTISFFYIGLVPLIFSILVIYFYLNHKKKYHKFLLIACMSILVILIKVSQQPIPKFLSDTQSLNISAEVKTQIGLKSIINNDLSKTVLFTSTNPLGSTLFSLQNGARTSLDQVTQYSYGNYTTDLLYPQDSLPLMMITTGY